MRSDQSQAPEAGVTLAADHQMVVDGDAERFGGLPDLLGHLYVLARRLGIARGVVVHQSKLVQISLSLLPLMRSANSAGIVGWGMFLVRTRDFSRLTTTMHRRFQSNTFVHGFRVPTQLYPPSSGSVDPKGFSVPR